MLLGWLTASRHELELVAIEQGFAATVGDARLVGRVDRLERDDDGRLVVIDLKTGKTKVKADELPTHPQLGAYQLAVEAGAFGEGEQAGGARLVQLAAAGKDPEQQQGPARRLRGPELDRGHRRLRRRAHARQPVQRPGEHLLRQLRPQEVLSAVPRGPAGDAVTRDRPAPISPDLLSLHPPTPEQAAVIESPLAPAVVIAGAGSGKTETMAARVVWLVANRLVRPDQVLGLTFTRKAAAELGKRIRRRLVQWRHVVERERPGRDASTWQHCSPANRPC